MEADCDMDPGIWSNLPEELMDRVLAALPLLAFLQLRSVCKQWCSLIHSSHFCQLRQHSGVSHKPCFLFHVSVGSTGHLLIYDPALGKWGKQTLSFLPPGISASLVSVSGGLLCFKASKSDSACYLVCNPITKAYKELPPPLRYRSTFRSPSLQIMLVDEASNSHKIILAGYSTGRDSATEVYDSLTNSWRLVGDLPLKDDSKVTSIHPYSGQPICNGNIYCRSHLPPGVVSYSLEEESWTDLRVPICQSILSPYLVEYNGSILMVGGVRRQGRKELNPESFCIWELSMKDLQWIELARMPDSTCKLFLQKNIFAKFRATGQSGNSWVS
ncbi:hypothetical protein O6H91_05G056400 [Diphasiastrum complanatum]|uniref:Uncharacterized protein n=1 Tax=Diphasiastrum complanatum TaxID=34168 RepID=A0ACC2DNH8_DIPCM|nr:hypothetical protein O6H91_05G056400 [Diphasiastrum complanatum]